MDIYSFINSEAVRTHCKSANHKFNANECARIVFESREHSIEEKHKAYKEIIETMPNEAMQLHSGNSDISIHEFLRRHMKYEKRALDKFYKSDENAEFSFTLCYDDGVTYESEHLYKTIEECYAEIEQLHNNLYPIKFGKISKNSSDANRNGVKIWTHISFYADLKAVYSVNDYHLRDSFDEIYKAWWVDIPTPFKTGDILYSPYYYRDDLSVPFVYDKRCAKAKNGSVNITAWGYFLENNERDINKFIAYDYVYNYFSLEYYNEELRKETRILKTISNYMNGKIDLALLLNAYDILQKENHIENLRLSLRNSQYELRDAELMKTNSSEPTAWMIRSDGRAIPCIQHIYANPNELYETLYAAEWLYRNTKSDGVREQILSLVHSYGVKLDTSKPIEAILNDVKSKPYRFLSQRFINIYQNPILRTRTDDIGELSKDIEIALNQEFLRARYGGLYNTDKNSRDIYFRISSNDFDWSKIIVRFLKDRVYMVDTVTVVRDEEITGKNETLYDHIPAVEFLAGEQEPII